MWTPSGPSQWLQTPWHYEYLVEARGYFIARLRRRLALVVTREMARHRLNRVQFIGMPRAVVEARMRARARTAAAVADGSGSAPRLGDFHGWQVRNFAPDAAVGA